jgi:hypothetical protein
LNIRRPHVRDRNHVAFLHECLAAAVFRISSKTRLAGTQITGRTDLTGVSSEAMTRPIMLLGAKRRRGNPNWSQPPQHFPVVPTEFEMQVKRIGLTKPEYIASTELKLWCKRNRNRVYLPEWLLQAWGMEVESIFSGVASPA